MEILLVDDASERGNMNADQLNVCINYSYTPDNGHTSLYGTFPLLEYSEASTLRTLNFRKYIK